ncbi:NAD(P)-dependent oxidoreductase [Devosia sp.]|uniref:NAD(P)-dependent oxidoreductase n=1 Tax=Devosia sp. TaxID=1871048 RepID=UPI003A9421A0
MRRIAIIGISGKLGQHMATHALDRGYDVVGVCRPESVTKLRRFGDRLTLFTGDTSDPQLIAQAVKHCDGVLTVLVPWGTDGMASRTALAVLGHAADGARLVFSGGWHMRRDSRDRYPLLQSLVNWIFGRIARLTQMADIDDHKRAARLIFSSDKSWTLVRASDLEEGDSQGLPVWAPHVGDPMLKSNITRRTDFALFMVNALTDDRLIHQAPAIVSRAAASDQDLGRTAMHATT